MQVQPYLNFDGRCEEALEFYRRAIGAEVTALMRFKEMPATDEACPTNPATADKVMHASLRVGESVVMASDCHCTGAPEFRGVTLSLQAKDAAEAGRQFAALSDGGQVTMPLGPTFWSPAFGMVTDRFGLSWMVNVAA